MKTTFLAAAAATAMLVAAPALAASPAKDRIAQNSATQPNAAPSHAATPPMKNTTRHTAKQTKATHHRKHTSRVHSSRYDRGAIYHDNWNRPMRTGFAPLDFAGNVAGSAIGTAGAIAGAAVGTAGVVAAAPFGVGPYGYRNAYAYAPNYAYAPDYADSGFYDDGAPYRYDGTAIQYSSNYAARNGFVCQPGTWYTNSYGQQQFCQ